jgi:hypothetical protein
VPKKPLFIPTEIPWQILKRKDLEELTKEARFNPIVSTGVFYKELQEEI